MTGRRATLRDRLVGAARVIRDGWLIVGVTILMMLALESAYRFQGIVREAVASRFAPTRSAAPPSPFEETDWAADYWIGHGKEEAVRWAPYVYLRNPTFEAPHASVDTSGHRITPHPAPPPGGGRTVRIFFLGGSTTFGWYQRADHTIPAVAARRIQALLGETARVEATNFGVPGHTFTQEILELLLQLRAGARPDVVVFYDGINDVMATVQNGEAGLPQNEWNREEDFVRGRQLAAERPPGFANDLRTLRRIAGAAVPRLQIARRIMAARAPPPVPLKPANELARSIGRMYAENARIVETLAAGYGFQPIYVWQPALLSSRKPLTARERWLRRAEADPDGFVRTMRDVHVAVPAEIGPAMAPIAGDRFLDVTTLFDDDPGEVFVDLFGHTYERATPRIVDRMMGPLAAAGAGRSVPPEGK